MDPLQSFELVLKVVACCNIISGIPGSLKMWQTGKTEGWPTLFFVIGFCGATGMFCYGALTDNYTLMMLNALHTTVNCYYVISYIMLAEDKTTPIMYASAAALYLTALYNGCLVFDETQLDGRKNLMGSSSSAIFLIMNCSTILDVIGAVRTKSAVFDLPMLIFGMLNNLLWLIYGLLLDDIFLYGPPLPFLLTGCMKFLLISIYSTSDKKKAE